MRRCVSSVKQDLRSSYNSLFTKRRKLTFNSSFSDKIQCMQEESPSLLSKKKFLQSVLAIVKKSQIGILSSKTNNKKNQIKDLLTNLVKELSNNLKEKESIRMKLENKIKHKKETMYKEMFGKHFFWKSNNVNKLEETKENEEVYDEKENKNEKANAFHSLNAELKYLKFLNFNIENQISVIDDEFGLKLFTYNYLKNVKFMKEINREKKCKHKEDIKEAGNILHNKLVHNRKQFTQLVSKKNIQNEEIINLVNKINSIEKNIYYSAKRGSKRYIDSNDVIPEISYDYTRQNNFLTNESQNIKNMIVINNMEYQNQISNIINISNINNVFNIQIFNNKFDIEEEKNVEDLGNIKLRKNLFIKKTNNNIQMQNL
jgi:hypothetical protein